MTRHYYFISLSRLTLVKQSEYFFVCEFGAAACYIVDSPYTRVKPSSSSLTISFVIFFFCRLHFIGDLNILPICFIHFRYIFDGICWGTKVRDQKEDDWLSPLGEEESHISIVEKEFTAIFLLFSYIIRCLQGGHKAFLNAIVAQLLFLFSSFHCYIHWTGTHHFQHNSLFQNGYINT